MLKISDFGMARVGVYVNSVQKRQPLRWMAPEAIESRTCNNKTDVWSFGVVLWEIGTLGKMSLDPNLINLFGGISRSFPVQKPE